MSSIRSILEELRYDIEDVCDDKYVGWVKPVEELSARIDGLVDQALKEISELIDEVIGEDECDDYTEENTKPNHIDWSFRNDLREEQRNRKKELLK